MKEMLGIDLVKLIIRFRKLIISMTLICMLISAFVSYFVIKPEYEVKESISLMSIELKSGINPNSNFIISGDLNTINETKKLENKMLGSILSSIKYPQVDYSMINQFMNSTEYILKILDDFNIDTQKYDYTKKISVTYDKNTNLYTITVKYNDLDTALKIQKAIVEYIPVYIKNEVNEQLNVSTDFIKNGLEVEIKNFDTLEQQRTSFIDSVGGEDKIKSLSEAKQAEFEKIDNNYILTKQAIEAYRLIQKELYNIESLNFERLLHVQEISKPRMPINPISPRKGLNIVMAGLFGIMTSLLIALITNYTKAFRNYNLSQ